MDIAIPRHVSAQPTSTLLASRTNPQAQPTDHRSPMLLVYRGFKRLARCPLQPTSFLQVVDTEATGILPWVEACTHGRKSSILCLSSHHLIRINLQHSIFYGMAERVGFEPTVEFPLHTLSKRAPSTTRPSLRVLRISGLRASGSAQNPNCDRNCDTPPKGLRSLTGTSSDTDGAQPDQYTARRLPHNR